MILISKPIKDSAQCRYYLAMSRTDYYANLYDEPGYWAGKGAKRLGFSGQVEAKVLQNGFDGYSPDGTTKLVQNAGSPDRQRAIDMVVSPPKSFAVFWAMAAPAEQKTLIRLHHEAVEAAREYLEEQAGRTRWGQGGNRIEPADMVFACFDHITSRANDPLPHTHLLALNLVVREDGTTGTLYNHELYVHRAKADMIYKVHLTLGLMLEMGLKVEEEGHAFRIVGVPKEVCDVFSKRRAEIVEYLEEHDLSGAAAASVAALATRSAKQHIPREELFTMWHRIGRALGWGPEQAALLSREKKVMKLAAKFGRLMEGEPGSEQRAKETSETGRTKANGPEGRSEQNGNGPWKASGSEERRERSESERASSAGSQERREGKHDETPPWGEKASHDDSANSSWKKPKKSSLFRQDSKGNFVLKHARWGDILWKVNLGIVEIRIQKKRLFRKSPGINPASKLAVPALRVIPWRIKIFDKVPPHKRPQPKLLWKKKLLLAEVRLQRERLFPDAPWWSPLKKVEHVRLKVGWRSSEISESAKKKESHKQGRSDQQQRKSEGMSQSP